MQKPRPWQWAALIPPWGSFTLAAAAFGIVYGRRLFATVGILLAHLTALDVLLLVGVALLIIGIVDAVRWASSFVRWVGHDEPCSGTVHRSLVERVNEMVNQRLGPAVLGRLDEVGRAQRKQADLQPEKEA